MRRGRRPKTAGWAWRGRRAWENLGMLSRAEAKKLAALAAGFRRDDHLHCRHHSFTTKMGSEVLKARRRSDYKFELEYRTRW